MGPEWLSWMLNNAPEEYHDDASQACYDAEAYRERGNPVERHARIYEAAARIAAGLVGVKDAADSVIADRAAAFALRLDRAVATALEEDDES